MKFTEGFGARALAFKSDVLAVKNQTQPDFTHATILSFNCFMAPSSRQKWPAPSISAHSKLDLDSLDCFSAQDFKRLADVNTSVEPKTAKVELCNNGVKSCVHGVSVGNHHGFYTISLALVRHGTHRIVSFSSKLSTCEAP